MIYIGELVILEYSLHKNNIVMYKNCFIHNNNIVMYKNGLYKNRLSCYLHIMAKIPSVRACRLVETLYTTLI